MVNNKISFIQILSLLISRRVVSFLPRTSKKRYGITRGKQSLAFHWGYNSKYFYLGNAGNRTMFIGMPTMRFNRFLNVTIERV